MSKPRPGEGARLTGDRDHDTAPADRGRRDLDYWTISLTPEEDGVWLALAICGWYWLDARRRTPHQALAGIAREISYVRRQGWGRT